MKRKSLKNEIFLLIPSVSKTGKHILIPLERLKYPPKNKNYSTKTEEHFPPGSVVFSP